ncbi:bifunctional 3-dehydroquinate dehydratase/shikimate dehydrogenase [Chlamydia crocodili]|uniref:shikimate dehydrogenase (NADP(+)) n=1 Tax=Chlamydia crocodili TaxID=2766982 RepID=A0ABX8CHE4_9CHLA|nr:bifunctional 3-dehydroquinate dehydratase/shikimate dehydrogenase [Chlamydia crocodili]QVE49255.1 bifunctional 3-dehydroquinate dehydratase/shikimate dehydrogenase [Chlamydia crocodili]
MLCATISGPSFSEAKQQLLHSLPLVDSIELRIDCLLSLSLDQLKHLVSLAKKPILTLKKHASLSESVWVERTMELAKLQPDYLDIDKDFPKEALRNIQNQYPNIKIILSYHSKTSEYVPNLYNDMLKQQAHHYKIAITSTKSIDTLRYIRIKKYLPENTTVLCMGNEGIASRILSPLMKNAINYASGINAPKVAPGQLSIEDLLAYNYANLSSESSIYGLIGNPVDRSISHLSHNKLFSELNMKMSYIKILLTSQELKDFFSLTRDLPFRGLSVTMPFKTDVLDYIDILDTSVKHCQSCNTLVFNNNKITGYNTDGSGLLNLLKRKNITLQNTHVAIVGSGGAAMAIATTFAYSGARISIFNRTEAHAKKLAELCNGNAFPLSSLSENLNIDILILCLPPNVEIPEVFSPVIIDINTLPKESHYTRKAKTKGCHILYGYEMFAEQALLQFSLWFPEKLSEEDNERFRISVENIVNAM